MVRVGEGEGGAEVVAPLGEVGFAVGFLFLRGGERDLRGFEACGDGVDVGFVGGFERGFEVREQVVAPADAVAFADFPFALLAFEDVLGDEGGVGEGGLGGGFGAVFVGFEGAGEGFVGMVDCELGLCWEGGSVSGG